MKALINNNYLLEKYSGKGGWTFVVIPELTKDVRDRLKLVKVNGTIDGFVIQKYHLSPITGGGVFLPVRSEIRKAIGKKEGDRVHIILYADSEPIEVPEELLICLREEPIASLFFDKLSQSEKLHYIKWIYSAKKEETKIDRMAKTINRLSRKLKMYDREE